VHAHALVVDVDDGGDVDVAADTVAKYAAVVHETFSSTADKPRCRIVLLLSEPIDAPTYEATHKVVRAHLAAAGLVADEAAKDASRLSYSPVRRPGGGYRIRLVRGAPLHAAAVLSAQPPPSPRPVARPDEPDHRDAYIRAALRRAADAVASSPEGARNSTLNRETHSLARLDGLDDGIIEMTMNDAAKAAGLSSWEAQKTISSAIKARRGAA
jgi:hypothetical protein